MCNLIWLKSELLIDKDIFRLFCKASKTHNLVLCLASGRFKPLYDMVVGAVPSFVLCKSLCVGKTWQRSDSHIVVWVDEKHDGLSGGFSSHLFQWDPNSVHGCRQPTTSSQSCMLTRNILISCRFITQVRRSSFELLKIMFKRDLR